MNKGKRIFSYLISIHFLVQTTAGQAGDAFKNGNEFQFEQFSINQGLSHVGVTAILQDHSGFLWVGTYDGLNRFDGLNVEIFKKDTDQSSSLINNRVHSLFEDHKERLWIGTEEGVSILDLKTFEFNKLKLPEQLSGIKLNVWRIVSIHENEIWILTANYGLLRFSADGDYILGIDLSGFHVSGKPTLNDAIKINEKEYIICTTLGLYKYDVVMNEFLPLFTGEIGNARTIVRIKDTFLVGTIDGMVVLVLKDNKLTMDRHIFRNQDIFSITCDQDENIWIGTNGYGLYYGGKVNKDYQFVHYCNNAVTENPLRAERIGYIYQDDANGIWLGSLHQGLFRVDTKARGFITIRNKNRNSSIAPSNYVTCLSAADEGNLLVGFRGEGLRLFDPKNKEFLRLPFNTDPIASGTVSGTLKDSHGILWILTWNGLFRLLPGNPNLEIINPEGLTGQFACMSVQEDKYGRIWLGTRSGLYRIKMDGDLRILNIAEIKGQDDVWAPDVVQSLYYDDISEELWIGTHHSGLFILPLRENEQESPVYHLHNYSVDNTGREGIKSNFISCILRSSDGHHYIGTEGGGISKVKGNLGSQKFSTYSEDEGLKNNSVKSILEDDDNMFWIGTNNGLFQFHAESGNFNLFTYRDGIQSNAFNYPCLKLADGSLFFGGIDGFTFFRSQNIHKDLDPPRVVFDNFYLSYKKVLPGTELANHVLLPSSLSCMDTIVLNYNENTFSAEIVPIHYTDPASNRIKYKLENYDNNWIDADAYSNVASYSKLKPGHYILKAIASNSDYVWTPKPEVLHIIVRPPYWQTKLAFFVYFILFTLAVYLAYRIISRITRLRAELKIGIIEKEKESELNEAKLRFFTNISHEFKTPISLILGPVHWLSERLKDNPQLNQKVTLINNQATYLLKLVEQLLEFRKAEKDTMKLQCSRSNIIAFIENIKDSFEIYAQQKDITFEMDASHSSIPIWFDPNKMEKIINNVLSNAFKYTNPGGIISINIKATYLDGEKHGVIIQISDTGKGISPESLPRIFDRFYQENENLGGGGIGLSLTKSLVELHKGKIWVESEAGKGSTFYLEFLSGDDHIEDKDWSESFHPEKYLPLNDAILDIEGAGEMIRKTEEIFFREKTGLKKNLLIVEDHFELRKFIREAFQDNFRVLVAGNGMEALQIIEKEFPVAVISDILMPEMDGIELCRKIKTDKSYCHIPVILLTSKESYESRIEGLETGADAYLTKPFQIDHLMVQLNNILENRENIYEKFKNGFPLDLEEVHISSMESEFLEKVLSIVKDHLEDPDFDSIQFAREMYMNRTHFYRKMKAITNLTPGEYLRNYRLTVAAGLILKEKLNVSEVIYRVGMKSRSNFTRCFKEKFGINPHDYKASFAKY